MLVADRMILADFPHNGAGSTTSLAQADTIQILMKGLFDFLSMLEFCPRPFNIRIARKGAPVASVSVPWSAALSCFSPAIENAPLNSSSWTGRDSLPIAMLISSGIASRKAVFASA
jgi:hypothetical protein